MANARTRHDGRGRFVRTIDHVEQDREAAVLYQRFASYSEVGRVQGVDTATAYRRVQRALYLEPDDTTEAARRVALARLNAMALIAQQVAEEDHIAHSNGRVIYVENKAGERVPLRDRGPNLAALDKLRKIEDQRNRILGTYAPTATRLEVVPAEVIERLIADQKRKIGALEIELGIEPGAPIPDERPLCGPESPQSVAGMKGKPGLRLGDV
jgi:hypothetical protein